MAAAYGGESMKWIIIAAMFGALALGILAMLDDDYDNWQKDDWR